jgi:hypothetical protein
MLIEVVRPLHIPIRCKKVIEDSVECIYGASQGSCLKQYPGAAPKSALLLLKRIQPLVECSSVFALQPAYGAERGGLVNYPSRVDFLHLLAWNNLVHKQSKPSWASSQYLFWEVLENSNSINSRKWDEVCEELFQEGRCGGMYLYGPNILVNKLLAAAFVTTLVIPEHFSGPVAAVQGAVLDGLGDVFYGNILFCG